MRDKSEPVDRVIAWVASRQHGLITTEQLERAGLRRAAISRRVAQGRLHRVHQGVYRVGHRAPSIEADLLAAVLACGAGAALAGKAAGHLFRIVRGGPPMPVVIAPANRARRGIRTCRATLDPRDLTIYRRIPTTTIPRTLVDLAAGLPLDALAEACHRASALHKMTPAAVAAAARRKYNAPGIAKLRAIYVGDAPIVLSELERLFLVAMQAHDLPLPVTNRPSGAHYVDCRWPHHRLTVELDSYKFHSSRHAWEEDYRRARAARARGDEFRRYTWADVAEDQSFMVAELESLLRA